MNRFRVAKSLQASFASFAAALAVSLLAAAPALAAGVEPAAKALAQLDEDWAKAAAAKDLERVMSFYADDAVVYPPNEPVAVGKAAAKKVWGSYFADPSFAISWKVLHAGVSKSGDLGFTAGTYEDSYKAADGKQVTEKGKYLSTWRKQKDGSWKSIHDIWNTDSK